MLGKGRPVEIDAQLLTAACAFGAALSFFGAVRVVAGAWIGLPVSTPMLPAGGLLWSAPLAALAAWLGGSGGARFAGRGWNPAFRAAEGAGVAAVAALLVEVAGGYRFPSGTPPWAFVAASLPALQALVAWAAAYWVAQSLHAVAIGGRGEDAGAWQGAYRAVRDRLLALAVVVAGGWAAASLSVFGDPGAGGALAFAGGALFAASGLALIARVHQRAILLEMEGEGAKVDAGIESGGGRAGTWLLILPAAAALLIPANLSPLGAWNFNRWMERLTERLGPLLMPSQAPTRRIGEELGRLSLDRFLVELAGRGRSGDGWGGSLIVLALFFAAVAFAAWRVFRTPVRGERSAGMGRLPVGIRWLYEQIRALVMHWLARWGIGRPVPEEKESAASRPYGRARGPRRRERSSVAAIYVDVVGRMGRRGFLRRPTETPLEYLGRYRAQAASGDDADFARLTDLYISERYGEKNATAGILGEARRRAARALRALSQGRLASAVKSWVRQIGPKPRSGE